MTACERLFVGFLATFDALLNGVDVAFGWLRIMYHNVGLIPGQCGQYVVVVSLAVAVAVAVRRSAVPVDGRQCQMEIGAVGCEQFS